MNGLCQRHTSPRSSRPLLHSTQGHLLILIPGRSNLSKTWFPSTSHKEWCLHGLFMPSYPLGRDKLCEGGKGRERMQCRRDLAVCLYVGVCVCVFARVSVYVCYSEMGLDLMVLCDPVYVCVCE